MDIKYWWKNDGRYLLSNIRQGIVNLLVWFRIIWNDRNYDYAYIYNVLEFKLKEQAKYLRKKDRFVSTERSCEKIELCIRLIDRIKNGYYEMEHMDYQEIDMEIVPIDETKSKLELVEISENLQDYFDKYPLVYRRVTKTDKYILDNNSKGNIATNMAMYNQKRCEYLLYELMRNNINSWWD